ncbi:hypothetical protein Plec18170_009776 [Paecilomyces lecythidis]
MAAEKDSGMPNSNSLGCASPGDDASILNSDLSDCLNCWQERATDPKNNPNLLNLLNKVKSLFTNFYKGIREILKEWERGLWEEAKAETEKAKREIERLETEKEKNKNALFNDIRSLNKEKRNALRRKLENEPHDKVTNEIIGNMSNRYRVVPFWNQKTEVFGLLKLRFKVTVSKEP